MSVNSIGETGRIATNSAQPKKLRDNVDFANVLKSMEQGTAIDLDGIFEAASNKYGVPVNLLKAVAKAESGFHVDATSCCGAMGIMQLMPATAEALGVGDAYDPAQNIMGGAKYLSQMLSEFDGNVAFAVAAYNAGPGNVKKFNGIPPFAETQNYVEKVMGYCGSNTSAGLIPAASAPSSCLQNILSSVAADDNENETDSLATMARMSIYRMQMRLLEETEEDQNLIF